MIAWSNALFGLSSSLFISVLLLAYGDSIPRVVAGIIGVILLIILIITSIFFLGKEAWLAFFYKSVANQDWNYTQRQFLKTQAANPTADQQFAATRNESIDAQRKLVVIKNLIGIIIGFPTATLLLVATVPDYKDRLLNAWLQRSDTTLFLFLLPVIVIGAVLLKLTLYNKFRYRWMPGKVALETRDSEKEQLAIDYRKMPLWLQVIIWSIMIGLMIASISLRMKR